MRRAVEIVRKAAPDLSEFDYCLPIPSSSTFCGRFADVVSDELGIPVLVPDFLRKRTIGEVAAAVAANPPKLKQGQKGVFSTQLHTWGKSNQDATYQAKLVDARIRHLFQALEVVAVPHNLAGKRVLIVDDLFATGSSILSVREILHDMWGAEVGGLCFLSGS